METISAKKRKWAQWEIDVLVDHYPEKGAVGIQPMLDNRSVGSIHQLAKRYELTACNNPALPKTVNPWPRGDTDADSAIQTRCDMALNNFRAAKPANDLRWRISA